ncbi:hypothetical protein F4802DRAFT_418401 [Xylaria palmicola]|nr:hypothetical protein F4802DRAFT_418401 [Xylaria palmicola]
MDEHAGLVPRVFGRANAVSLAASLRGQGQHAPSEAGGDQRNHRGHKYSNKNWDWHHSNWLQHPRQRQRSGSTAQPSPPTPAQPEAPAPVHAQSDLVEAPQHRQPDPYQSHPPSNAHWQWQQHQHQQRAEPGPADRRQRRSQQGQQNDQQSDAAAVPSPPPPPHPHSPRHPPFHPLHSPLHSPSHHQPYRASSQPPRLPPLAASLPIPLSPFDPFHACDGDNYFLSSAAPTAPATPGTAPSSVPRLPALPAQRDDVVSPISETSSPTPVLRGLDREQPAVQPLARLTAATALNRQPTSHSSAGASLLDDKDFERSLGATGRPELPEPPATSPSRSVFAAVKSAVAHDVAHLTDERSDDWFRYTARESTISRYTSNSHPEAQQIMKAAVMADQPSVPELPRQNDQFVVATTSSFTPLPPIRRTSTFDLLRKKGLVDDDSDTAPSPIEKDIPPRPPGPADTGRQPSSGQSSAGQNAPHSSPHNSVQPHPPPTASLNPTFHAPGQAQNQSESQSQSQAMPPQWNGLASASPAVQPGMPQHLATQMHPHQMMMARGGPAGQQVAPGHMMINGQGQTVISLPGGQQWIEQNSKLAEPLNPSNRNRSANSLQQPYPDYDKEEGPLPPVGGASSRPLQTRLRNTSNPVPPTAATRYPALFPTAEQHPFTHGQGPVPLSQRPFLRQDGVARPRESFDDAALSKELGGRVDQVPHPSIMSEDIDDKPRRGSGQIFNLGHRRHPSSVATAQQGPSEGAPEKKKHFFPSMAGLNHSQPKTKSNFGLTKTSTYNDTDQASIQKVGDNVPVKKRLSELKGMIKGVGNAKEGAKDDQPVQVETVYESRESMQSPPLNATTPPGVQGPHRQPVPFGSPGQLGGFGPQAQARLPQASMPIQPSQIGQHVMSSSQFPAGIGRASTGEPQPGQIQQVKSEESSKKGSGGGFLGGLFSKQGNKTKDVKRSSPQQMPPLSQRPMQPPAPVGNLPFRPAHMHTPGQQLGPHPMFAGQLPVQRGLPGQSPGQSPSPTFQDPSQPPLLETAQAITIRRPSEITVSTQNYPPGHQPSNPRPNMPSPQGSHSTFGRQAGPSPLGQRLGQTGLQGDGGMTPSQTSPQLSDDSPLKSAAGTPSVSSRHPPNRKPVGSGHSREDGHFMTSAVSPATVRPDRSTASPSPLPGEQRAPSQLSQAHHASQTESSMRQPSLPSLEPSPVPSQSNHSSSPMLYDDQFARNSPGPREPGQGLGVFSNGLTPPGPMNGPGPGGPIKGSMWGPNSFRPSVPPLATPSAAARVPPPRTPSSPVPSLDQGKLGQILGAYAGGRPAGQPQANKEKSAASKFLGAFKRSSKPSETSPSPRPQTSPQSPQQAIRPGGPSPGALPGNNSIPGFAGAPGRQVGAPQGQPGQGRGLAATQVLPHQMQAGRGQPGQIWSPGMPIPAQAARGPVPPGMIIQGGRGQLPPALFAGGGPVPPHMQRPPAPGKQGNEPQYDQVPIPQGYQAVHGYGAGGMIAPSPYNAGLSGHPAIPQQPWGPPVIRSPQTGLPPGNALGVSQIMPPSVPNSIRYQGAPQQPQLQGPAQASSPIPQSLPPTTAHQLPPQQFLQPQQPRLSAQWPQVTQGQMPTQTGREQQLQLSRPHEQEFQRGPSAGAQVQLDTNLREKLPHTQSPASTQQIDPPNHNQNPPDSLRAVSISDSSSSNGTSSTQSQYMAAINPARPPDVTQASSMHYTSPLSQTGSPSMQGPSGPSQGQQDPVRAPLQSPSSASTSASGILRSPDAARLTSRMSISQHATKSDASLSPDKLGDRTLAVSPEPSGPHHGPVHQVSAQTLSVIVDRSNSYMRRESEDIYNATPRLDSSTPQDQTQREGPEGEDLAHEYAKHAGSEKGLGLINGTAVGAGVGVAAGAASAAAVATTPLAEDNMSFLDGPDDSEGDEDSITAEGESREKLETQPPLHSVAMNMEPEEKILVDQPVELAAVNDDDDGIPMMTATSYPGQEWNPYGAGEFGDWE